MSFESFVGGMLGGFICLLLIAFVATHTDKRAELQCIDGYRFVSGQQLIDANGNGVRCDSEHTRESER